MTDKRPTICKECKHFMEGWPPDYPNMPHCRASVTKKTNYVTGEVTDPYYMAASSINCTGTCPDFEPLDGPADLDELNAAVEVGEV